MFLLFFFLEEIWEIDHMQWHPENQNEIKISERCQQSDALGNDFDLYKSLVSLTARHNNLAHIVKI